MSEQNLLQEEIKNSYLGFYYGNNVALENGDKSRM